VRRCGRVRPPRRFVDRPKQRKVVCVEASPSDIAAIRAAEAALAEAFEDPDRTAWVYRYTEDAIFVGPGVPTITGRDALLALVPQISMSSLEIVADSTIGSFDLIATTGRASWVSGPKGSDAPTIRRRFLMVWRKGGDGVWRLAREHLNEDV
jgi:ketosteroid isomerase-like protein